MSTELVREVHQVGLATATNYTIKRNFWSVFERVFRVFTPDGQMMMYVKHPLFKLREEFQVTRDEAQTQPVMRIKSRQAIAINFTYDVIEAGTEVLLGSVQKRGLKSIVRDKFMILDGSGAEIGYMEEQGASVLRRFFPWLTSKHAIFIGGAQVGFIRQQFRFFTKEFHVELTPGGVQPHFVLACALLALIAEARRESN